MVLVHALNDPNDGNTTTIGDPFHHLQERNEDGNEMGRLCYGLGASENGSAIRFILIHESTRSLIAGGDDGNVISYSF